CALRRSLPAISAALSRSSPRSHMRLARSIAGASPAPHGSTSTGPRTTLASIRRTTAISQNFQIGGSKRLGRRDDHRARRSFVLAYAARQADDTLRPAMLDPAGRLLLTAPCRGDPVAAAVAGLVAWHRRDRARNGRTRVTTCNSRGTTSRAGARRSTPVAWSTPQQALSGPPWERTPWHAVQRAAWEALGTRA